MIERLLLTQKLHLFINKLGKLRQWKYKAGLYITYNNICIYWKVSKLMKNWMATLFRQYCKIHNLILIGFEFINFIYEDYAFTML